MSKKNGTKKSTNKPTDPDLVPLTVIEKEKREAKKVNGKKAATTKAAPKPKALAKDKPLSCLGAAVEVLKAKKEPMACKAMIEAMNVAKLWSSDAPTPAATLYSAILREIQTKGKDARFKKVARGHFELNA